MNFDKIKQQIVFEYLATYSKQVLESDSLASLAAPTKLCFKSIAGLVFPDKLIDMKPKLQGPPQEVVDQEESKEPPKIDIVRKLSEHAQAYVDAANLVKQSLEEEIDTLL